MTRFLRILSLLVILFCIGVDLHAQTPVTSPPAEPVTTEPVISGNDFYREQAFGIGLNVGLVSGAGLSGRATFPGGFLTQASFFVMTLGQWTHFNIGGEGQYSLIRNPDSRMYALLGMSYYSSTTDDTTRQGNRIANPFRTGLGIGYEWFAGRQFVVSISGALTYFPSTGEVLPTPQVGFFFYFR